MGLAGWQDTERFVLYTLQQRISSTGYTITRAIEGEGGRQDAHDLTSTSSMVSISRRVCLAGVVTDFRRWELAVAALRSGVVICPATTLLVEDDIKYRAQRSGATIFVGDSASVQKFLRIKQHCPLVKFVIQVDGSREAGVIDLAREVSTVPEDAVFQGSKARTKGSAIIYFTSGTTGYPKMVQHNHISYPLAHTITGKHWLRLGPKKLYWNLSEQGWAKAAWSFFGAWNCGAGLFIHDDRQAFNPRTTLEMLHTYPITTLCAPPTVYRQLVLDSIRTLFGQTPPKALEHCTGAGEPLNAEVIRLWKQMSGIEICDGYGQTETIMMCGNFANAPIRPGSMGRPSPGVPLHVINDQGGECPVGEEGDIAVAVKAENAGPGDFFGIFDGYINQDDTLDRRLKAAARSIGTSWYCTGDRAIRDSEGYFWFVGRNDDVINSAGYRIGEFADVCFQSILRWLTIKQVRSRSSQRSSSIQVSWNQLSCLLLTLNVEKLSKHSWCLRKSTPTRTPRVWPRSSRTSARTKRPRTNIPERSNLLRPTSCPKQSVGRSSVTN